MCNINVNFLRGNIYLTNMNKCVNLNFDLTNIDSV